MRKVIWLMILVVLILTGAFDVTYGNSGQRLKVTNEMIYQKLIEIERRVGEIEKKQAVFEERFKQIDRRFEDIDKRFEDMNERFEDMNKRLDSMVTLMNRIVIGLFGLVAAFGALLIWDRRTTIKAVSQEIEESLNRKYEIEKLKPLFAALRELAKTDEKLRAILKQFNLL